MQGHTASESISHGVTPFCPTLNLCCPLCPQDHRAAMDAVTGKQHLLQAVGMGLAQPPDSSSPAGAGHSGETQ